MKATSSFGIAGVVSEIRTMHLPITDLKFLIASPVCSVPLSSGGMTLNAALCTLAILCRCDGDVISWRYGIALGFWWELECWRRHDNDVFTTVWHSTMTACCVFCRWVVNPSPQKVLFNGILRCFACWCNHQWCSKYQICVARLGNTPLCMIWTI